MLIIPVVLIPAVLALQEGVITVVVLTTPECPAGTFQKKISITSQKPQIAEMESVETEERTGNVPAEKTSRIMARLAQLSAALVGEQHFIYFRIGI